MQLIQRIPGHFRLNETAPAWLADVVMDLAMFPAGTLPVTFTADVVVEGEIETGYFFISTGGDPRTIGTDAAAALEQAGPFSGAATGANAAGVAQSTSPVVLHLMAAITSSSYFIEISNVRITVGAA
jgi:hypothetical protein